MTVKVKNEPVRGGFDLRLFWCNSNRSVDVSFCF